MAINPIAFTEKVVGNFLRYQLSAYPFSDPDLNAQMRELLSLGQARDTPLLKGPYVSLSQMFRVGAKVKDLVDEGIFHPHMANLIGFDNLYGHQERAIRAIHGGRTTLVSTGTGSGKTECFLYPIISKCLQLKDEGAPKGISAVIVYPMNALAEDQLQRLRGLLAGTGVSFGMYVGKTPDKDHEAGVRRVHGKAGYQAALREIRETGSGAPPVPEEERVSRASMRESPPRILLTNVKQMEYLLTRSNDAALFDNARLDYLVFDEAHTFTGAQGAETACLIRRLRTYCNRTPQETVCVATSATIADPNEEEGMEVAGVFASRFFGVDGKSIALIGEEYEEEEWGKSQRFDLTLREEPAQALRAILEAVDAGEETRGQAVLTAYASATGRRLGSAPGQLINNEDGMFCSDDLASLFDELKQLRVVAEMVDLLRKPRRLDELIDKLTARLGRDVSQEEVLCWLALGAVARKQSRTLLRPVVHAFVKGIDGAVVSFPEERDELYPAKLWLSAEDEIRKSTGSDKADAKDYQQTRLHTLTCTTCGQHYYEHWLEDWDFSSKKPGRGRASEDGSAHWEALEASQGGKRALLVDRQLGMAEDAVGEDDDDGASSGGEPEKGVAVYLCRVCGTLHPHNRESCESCADRSGLVRLYALPTSDKYEGKRTTCIACGAKSKSRGSRYFEPMRPVRAVGVADVHVLAQDMIHNMEHRRLLVFADSRQDAAFQAGWMRDHARRFRIRSLMMEVINEKGPISVGDLTMELESIFEKDEELSRVLAPEVWNVARKEVAGRTHQRERATFLRIQVLREIITSSKQRYGLEPWGRIEVEYVGLNADAEFIQSKAKEHGIDPELLSNGIATILDNLRSGMVLSTPEPKHFFTRIWPEDLDFVKHGYTPHIRGIPSAICLEHIEGTDRRKSRNREWLSARGSIRQAILGWGIDKEVAPQFLQELWEFLVKQKILISVTPSGFKGKALQDCEGAHQIDAGRIRIKPHKGYQRCRKCRRTHVRAVPGNRCMGYRCTGELEPIAEDPDNYDLRMLDERFEMIRPREHSAQVPTHERERIEEKFKGDGNEINCLVATPTLEMGVDIGALDSVLMRNVPPLPANYWQRVGRAGRRHRMAVDVTYARSTSHDRQFFAEPARLLEGKVEPPNFNLANDVMIRKHVHSTILTRLRQLERNSESLSESDKAEIGRVLAETMPGIVRNFLFDDEGKVRATPLDVSMLTTLATKHQSDLAATIQRVFDQGWPAADSELIAPEVVARAIEEIGEELQKVVNRLFKRLQWALAQRRRLEAVRSEQGTLEYEDDTLLCRCDRLVRQLKGVDQRSRSQASGHDDSSTISVLEAEGFLPGYGLETGSILGTAVVPHRIIGLDDFALPRAPALALREYIPGNMIYANGQRFSAKRFHHDPERERLHFTIDPDTESVREQTDSPSKETASVSTLTEATLQALPVCDVDLFHASQIGDDEESRFRLSTAVYGYEGHRHGGGAVYSWGGRDLLHRKNVHFRLVNVGVSHLVKESKFGFPVCSVCGQGHSPLSGEKSMDSFVSRHVERCKIKETNIGFYADVIADAISIPDCASRKQAYSILEAIRMGASDRLDMDIEDLQLLVIGKQGSDQVDGVIYDPMPGGSGLLSQIIDRFDEVWDAAMTIVSGCPSKCGTACSDCLLTFRNGYYHKHLDRHEAYERLEELGDKLGRSNNIPALMPEKKSNDPNEATTPPEKQFKELVERFKFPSPDWKRHIELQGGGKYGSTTPDCCWDIDGETMLCVYIDGMSDPIHGNDERQSIDHFIRTTLVDMGHEVLQITAQDLEDRKQMARHMSEIALRLEGRARAKEVKRDPLWDVD